MAFRWADVTIRGAIFCLFLGSAAGAFADIIHVDDDGPGDLWPGDPNTGDPLEDGSLDHPFDSIQEAIDSAEPDDTVMVADGTYTGPGNREIDFLGKAITVRSANGPQNCVMDCQGVTYGFNFHNGETSASVLDGFTIINGYAPAIPGWLQGPGINIYNSSPTIIRCVIKNCSGYFSGGIYCLVSNSRIINCLISHNTAVSGGAIRISGNGPGMEDDCQIMIINCTITQSAAETGRVINYGYAKVMVENCIIWGNTPPYAYPGEGPDLTMNYTIIEGGWPGVNNINQDPCFAAVDDFHLTEDSPAIDAADNTIIPAELLTDLDGNERFYDYPLTPDTGNPGAPPAPIADRGCYEFYPPSNLVALPKEIYFTAYQNGADPDNQTLHIYNLGDSPLPWQISEDCPWLSVAPAEGIAGAEPNEVTLAVDITGLDWGLYSYTLNIIDPTSASDPRMVNVQLLVIGPVIDLSSEKFEFSLFMDDPNTAEQTLQIRNGGGDILNWRIEYQDPCNWLTFDPPCGSSAGEHDDVVLRVDKSGLNHGLYTCDLIVRDPNAQNNPQTITVNLYVNDVLHVPSAYPDIQAAIDAAIDKDIVVAADGTYLLDEDINFQGKSITVRSENGPDNCTIDGDRHGVLFANAEDVHTKFMGFTLINFFVYKYPKMYSIYCGPHSRPVISNCIFKKGTFPYSGRIYCENSSPTIINCLFQDIYERSCAPTGVIYCQGGGSPRIINCDFIGLHPDMNALAGIASLACDPNIINCTFSGLLNAIACGEGNVTITNCLVNQNIYGIAFNNTDGAITGCTITGNLYDGIHCTGNSAVTVSDCTINGNQIGINCQDSNPVIKNCTISRNINVNPQFPSAHGGGIRCQNSNPVIERCTITDNRAINGGGIYCYQSSPTISHCTISSNIAGSGGGIYNYIASCPSIKNSLITGNHATGSGGAVYCYFSGLVAQNCTFTGNKAQQGGAIRYDCMLMEMSSTIYNCILWNNSPPQIYPDSLWQIYHKYNNIQGGWPGLGNIDVDPLFVAPGYWDPNGTPDNLDDDFWVNGDYHLQSAGWRWDDSRQTWTWDDATSPCLDAGCPGSPLADEPLTFLPQDPANQWGQNLRINMGAYGGTDQASMPPYDWALLADLNNDGLVNLQDHAHQAADWLKSAPQLPGDLNRDGTINISDLILLLNDWLTKTIRR